MRWSGKDGFALLADVSQHCVCLSTVLGPEQLFYLHFSEFVNKLFAPAVCYLRSKKLMRHSWN